MNRNMHYPGEQRNSFIKVDQMGLIDTDRKVCSIHLTSVKWSWDPGRLYADKQLQNLYVSL